MKESPAYVQSLIDEKKNEIAGVEGQIESLRQQRARTEASRPGSLSRVRTIESIDDQIANLERQKANSPFEIETLQTRLEQAEQAEKDDEKILQSMPSLSKAQEDSKRLLLQLQAAKETSDRLITMRVQADQIRERTGKIITRPCTCSGFHSLRLLVELCEREANGQGGRVSVRYKDLPEQYI